MSKHETHTTRWYWQQVGGTLIEEFPSVQRGPTWGRRLLDAVLVRGGERRIAKASEVSLDGKDVIVVQTKNSRLGMYLMGQTLFSFDLLRPFKPKTIESVALCSIDDTILRPFLERFPNCKVVVCPPEVSQLTRRSTRTRRKRRAG